MLGWNTERIWPMIRALVVSACTKCSMIVRCILFGATDYLASCVDALRQVQQCMQRMCHAFCLCRGCVYLDDLLLGAWQLDVAPVKALTLSGCAPQAVSIPGTGLLMHSDHAGPHKENAHVHISACICSSTNWACSIMFWRAVRTWFSSRSDNRLEILRYT